MKPSGFMAYYITRPDLLLVEFQLGMMHALLIKYFADEFVLPINVVCQHLEVFSRILAEI